MGWFDDQIRQRKQSDDEVFEKSFETAVNSVLGRRFSFADEQAEDSVKQILGYFGLSSVKIPEEMTDDEERLEYICHVTGLMQRKVELTENWYKDAFGPFLAIEKETGKVTALLPKGLQSYYYFDSKHNKVKIDSKNQHNFETEALCFYKPFPQKALKGKDLLKFAVSTWSANDLIAFFVMLSIATLIGLFTPKLNYFLFNNVVEIKSISLLTSTVLFLICATFVRLVFIVLKTFYSGRIGTKMTFSIEAATMMRVLSLPSDFFKKFSSGEIIQRMDYLTSLSCSFESTIFGATFTGIFSLLYITQIFNYAPSLLLPALMIIVVTIGYSVFNTLYQMKIDKRIMELSAKNNGIGLSLIDGVQKIKLSGAEKRSFARWSESFSEETRITYNPPLIIKLNTTITLAITLIGQMVLYILSVKNNISVAEYYAFFSAYSMVFSAISMLISLGTDISKMKPALEMAAPLLETVPEESGNSHAVLNLHGTLELNKVSFRYNDNMPNIVNDLSLKITSGQYVAIVGKTGCGKSTLIRLLLGFEKPQKGAIYYDGKDIETLDKKSLRRKIGTVMQDDKLFLGTIFENITICLPRPTLDDAWAAAELAGIADDIRAMPMGMHTVISEGSGGISGGQRQRLIIARAIAPKPKILIFDEATSALDNITQKKISEALDTLNCTRIVIAHRLSTICHCDRILVLDKGQIVEDGTFDGLIEKKGIFAELVERQRLDVSTN